MLSALKQILLTTPIFRNNTIIMVCQYYVDMQTSLELYRERLSLLFIYYIVPGASASTISLFVKEFVKLISGMDRVPDSHIPARLKEAELIFLKMHISL